MVWAMGWREKAERLRVVIVSAGHQHAKPLSPAIKLVLALFRRAAAEPKEARNLALDLEGIPEIPDAEKPLWEPALIRGWKIQATMYLDDAKLWWLVHATRKDERTPNEGDIEVIHKVIDHLGGEPTRHAVIGPRNSPSGHPPPPFGWWTWRNRADLFEVQVYKGPDRVSKKNLIRIVPLGSRPTDGYERIDITKGDP